MNLPYEGHYTASKFGVRGFWQSLREKAPEVGARANLIAPWYTKTPMTVDMIAPMEKRGFRFSTVEQVVEGTMRAALDQSVSGKRFESPTRLELFVRYGKPLNCS